MVSSASRSSGSSTSATRHGGPTPGVPRRLPKVAQLRLAAQQREPGGARHALHVELRVDRVELADGLLDADGLHGTSFCGRDWDPGYSASGRARRISAPATSCRARCARSDGRDVGGLRALVAGLGVVGHLGAFGERPIALAHDALVMDEEVLAGLVRRDESEPLLVAEPLHGSSCHGCYLLCVAKRGGADEQRLRTLALLNARPVARHD